MKNAVRRVLLLSALMSPTALYALGLGEIRLNSALNQPFDAEIELVSAAAEDLAQLRAALASNDTFSRYGLDRPAYLSEFTFRVVRGTNGQDVLRVTSPRPVTEPFVTLLVEASWPRGRLLREYTVLLDPPVYAPGPSVSEPPVSAPRATAAAPAPEPSEPRPQPEVAAPSIEPGSSYRVQRNDTLWAIASEASPGSRSDVNRAMVAIFQKNPAAFEGNINMLRAGSVLEIPAASEMSSMSASAAAAEVSRQYRMWREGSAAVAGEAAEGGRLRLVTPEQGTPAASTTTVPAAQAAPTADATAGDLQSQVQRLEAELAEARRLLEVRNAELATLQGQAVPAAPGAEAPVTEPAAEPSVTPEAEAPTAAAPPTEEAAPEPAAETPAAEVPVTPVEEGPTLLERLAAYWWVLLALLAAALAFVFYRRSRGATGAAEEDLAEALARREPGDMRAKSAVAPAARGADIVVEERRPVEAPHVKPVPEPAAPEPSRKPVSIEDTLSGDVPVSVEAGDPLAEADFHMAYGLYDQAADLVQLAAKREPNRRDLKLKLLEIFFVWGNRDRFLEMAREMQASRASAQPGEWDKILIMGKQIASDDALFAGAAHTPPAGLDMELHAAAGELDMDLGADGGAATDLDLTAAAPEVSDGMGLDFVIDEPSRGAEESTQEVGIIDLGLEAGDLEQLDDEGGEDTVERPMEEDLLSATSILQSETAALEGLSEEEATSALDVSDMTGELPTIEMTKLGGKTGEIDFSLGDEATTMSEVGTKLDLARAYIDMGDPEGARSILEEVQKEGSAVQKQEAERLMANLP